MFRIRSRHPFKTDEHILLRHYHDCMQLNRRTSQITMNDLASGVYIVVGQNDFGIVRERLIVIK